jgi:hypothetical protein
MIDLIGDDKAIPKTNDKGKELTMGHVYTLGSLEKILSWVDHPILDLLEEVANLESIAYNQCNQAIVKRTRKRK